MRTFKVVKDIPLEYITTGECYTVDSLNTTCFYKRLEADDHGFHSSSFMSIARFKRALREGAIVFID